MHKFNFIAGAFALTICFAAVLINAGCGGKGGRTFLNVRPGSPANVYVIDLNPTTAMLQDIETQNNLSTAEDSDYDGLKDDVELALGTDPNDKDTDGDGLADGYELFFGDEGQLMAEIIVDADADGVFAATNNDEDQNGVNDGWEEDTDGDGIPNKLEMDGFYYELMGDPPGLPDDYPESLKDQHLYPWDGEDITKKYFKTDPMQANTDGDPYDDLLEATGINYDPAVAWPGRHPLVPAMPDIRVEIVNYNVTTIATITNEYDKEVNTSYTNTVEHLDKTETTDHVDTSVDASKGSVGWGVKAHVGYSHDRKHTVATKTTDTTSGYTTEDWKTATTADTDRAAKITFTYKVTNAGTAPAKDITLSFSLALGDENITSTTPSMPSLTLGVGDIFGPWTVPTAEDPEIVLTLDQLKLFDTGVPLQVVVSNVDASVKAVGDSSQWTKWSDYYTSIRAISSEVSIDTGDGNAKVRRVYIGGSSAYGPPVTALDAIIWSLSDSEVNVTPAGIIVDGKRLNFDGWRFSFDEKTITNLNESSFLETVIPPRPANDTPAYIFTKAAPVSPFDKPQVEWSSIDPDARLVKAYATDYFQVKDVKFYTAPGGTAYTMTGENTDLYAVNLPWGFTLTGHEAIVATNDTGKTTTIGGGTGEGIPLAVDSIWPVFGCNPARTGLSPYVGPQSITGSGFIRHYLSPWKFHAGGQVWASPVVGFDGTIYVGSTNGNFYAVNPNGTEKWRFSTKEDVRGAAAIGADGTIYIGSNDRHFYALRPDGSLKWSYQTNMWVRTHPIIGADGTIYFTTGPYLYAMSPEGTRKWRHQSVTTDDLMVSSPAIGSDGTIYVGSDDHNLYALKPDGSLKWSFPTGGVVQCTPAVGADGTIYFGSDDTNLYALFDNGTYYTEKWHASMGPGGQTSPTIAKDGTIYVGTGGGKNLYILKDNGSSYSTVERIDYSNVAAIYTSPAIGADGTIYFAFDDGIISGLIMGAAGAMPRASLFPSTQFPCKVRSSPAIADHRLYIGFDDGYLYALGP